MESRASSQNKARLIVLAVFVIGFTAGALSMNLYQRMNSPSVETEKQQPQDHILRKMDQSLGLTTEQRTEIRAILDETFKKYGEIRQEMEPQIKDFKPRFDSVRQQSRDRIRALLTQAQLAKFEEMVQQQDAQREKRNEKNTK
jgi:hypothetical protein